MNSCLKFFSSRRTFSFFSALKSEKAQLCLKEIIPKNRSLFNSQGKQRNFVFKNFFMDVSSSFYSFKNKRYYSQEEQFDPVKQGRFVTYQTPSTVLVDGLFGCRIGNLVNYTLPHLGNRKGIVLSLFKKQVLIALFESDSISKNQIFFFSEGFKK